MKKINKFIAFALAIIMTMGLMPATALAAQTYPYATQYYCHYKNGALISENDTPLDDTILYSTGSDNDYWKIVVSNVSDSELSSVIALLSGLDVGYKCAEIEDTNQTIVWNNGHPSADPIGTTYYEAKVVHAYDIKANKAAPVPKGNPGNPDTSTGSTGSTGGTTGSTGSTGNTGNTGNTGSTGSTGGTTTPDTTTTGGGSSTTGTTRYNPYIDVADNAWYYDAVTSINDLGIVLGVGENRFDPNGQLTWAQTVTFVVRTYQKQTGERVYNVDDQTGANWYDVYVDYAKNHGFISSVPANPNGYISRSDAAVLFDKALFDRTVVNELPTDYEYFFDVDKNDPAHSAIYSLASAGIVNGKGQQQKFLGWFCGDDTLTRAEAATIVARMVNTVDRVEIDVWDLVVYGLDESHPNYDAIMACIRGELINTGNTYHEMPEGLYCPELFDGVNKVFYIAIDPDADMLYDDVMTAIHRTTLGYHPTYRYYGSLYEYDEGRMDYTVKYPDGHTEVMKPTPPPTSAYTIAQELFEQAQYCSQPTNSKIGLPKILDNGQVTVALEYMATKLGITKDDLAEGYAQTTDYNLDVFAYQYALETRTNPYFKHGSSKFGHNATEGYATFGEFCHLLYDLGWTTFHTLPGSKVDANGNYYHFTHGSGIFGDGYAVVIRDANGNPAPEIFDWAAYGNGCWTDFYTNGFVPSTFSGTISTHDPI